MIVKKNSRVVAIVITIALLISIIVENPVLAALNPGDTAKTDYKSDLKGSDGKPYKIDSGKISCIGYRENGDTYKLSFIPSDENRKHHKIISGGESRYAYCIEWGIAYEDGITYKSKNAANDNYFKNLPETARLGIQLTTIYGRQPGMSCPVASCNDDDWYWATQVIIWEYQQKLRTSPSSKAGNGYLGKNFFYNTLKGRPAEKCYNYILKRIKDHQTLPSFSRATKSAAKTYKMKYDYSAGEFIVVLTDSNKIDTEIKTGNTSIISSKQGNKFTFTSSKALNSAVVMSGKKKVPAPEEALLIWGGATAKQAVMTGAKDHVVFYAKFITEKQGTVKIIKTSEDNIVSGIKFKISGNGMEEKTVTTGVDGTIATDLYPGAYTVTEITDGRYRMPTSQTVTVTEGNVSQVTFKNVLKKGKLDITKYKDSDMEGNRTPEAKAEFQIYAVNHESYVKTPLWQRDTITTGNDGKAATKDLPLGSYIVHQTKGAVGHKLADDFQVAITEDRKTYSFTINNDLINAELEITKIDKDSKKPVLIPGTIFKIKNVATGKFISFKTAATTTSTPSVVTTASEPARTEEFITGANGKVKLPGKIPFGSYQLIETKAPSGYILNSTPVDFIVDGKEKVVIVKQENSAQRGVIEITKSGEIYKPKNNKSDYEKIPLSAVTLDIVAANDIVTGDGDIKVKKGETVETLTTDENGKAVSGHLYLGQYLLVERETAPGYVLPEEGFPVEIKPGDQNKEIIKSEIEISNRLKKGDVLISKTDIVTGDSLPDTGIEILDKNKKVILSGRTDKKGEISFTELPSGQYYFREFDAPKGYLIDETPYLFEIKENGEVVKAELKNKKKGGTEVLRHKDKEKPDRKDDNKETESDAPQTDQNFHTELFYGLIIFSLMLLISITIKKKYENKHK